MEEKEVNKIKELLEKVFELAKFIITIIIVIFAILVVATFPIWVFRGDEITALEIRIWVAAFLFYTAIMIFGVLRMYNSIFANTRTLALMIRKLDSFIGQIKSVAANSDKLGKAFNSVSKTIERYTDKLAELINKQDKKDVEL